MMPAQTVNQVRQRINAVAAQTKTMECDFVQTKTVRMLNSKLVSRGKMYYQQASKLRWQYVTPYQYTFVLNGNQVRLKSHGRNDVINVAQNKMFKEITRIMMTSGRASARFLPPGSDPSPTTSAPWCRAF